MIRCQVLFSKNFERFCGRPPFLDGFILTRVQFRVNYFFKKILNDFAVARVFLTILIVPSVPICVNYFFRKSLRVVFCLLMVETVSFEKV